MPQTEPIIKCEQQWEGDSLTLSPHRAKATSATRHWLVTGTDNEEAALAALKDHIYDQGLNQYHGMGIHTLQIIERLTPDCWKIDAAYGISAIGINGDEDDGTPKETTSYSMSSTTMHVTHSRKTVRKYAVSGATAPDYKGAMSVRGGEVQGTDINVSTVAMTITHYFRKSQWSTRLRNRILNKGNRMNNKEFRGFDPGELLYLSATINPVTEGDVEYIQVDYNFAISPNDDDVDLAEWSGGSIKKEGWNFMWVKDETDPDTGLPVPKYVYIEQVYKTLDFTELGIKAKE